MSRRITTGKITSGAELRALREQRAATVTAASEADRREKSFLRNVAAAGDDLEWILLNQAWTQLGYERVGDWWEKRVLPVLVKLDVRPSVKLAEQVMAAIEADEAALPKAQRRTTREIATLARTSQTKVSRSLSKARESGSDLDGAADEVADATAVFDAKYSQDTPAAVSESDATEQLASRQQPGEDSSPVPSETVEAPADQPQVPDVPEGPPVVAVDQPGIDHPLPQVGEARADASPLGAGVTPLPELGEGTGGDEVEGEAEHSPSTDPDELFADAAWTFMDGWRKFVRQISGVDVEAVGPMLREDEFTELYGDLELLREQVKKLQRAGG